MSKMTRFMSKHVPAIVPALGISGMSTLIPGCLGAGWWGAAFFAYGLAVGIAIEWLRVGPLAKLKQKAAVPVISALVAIAGLAVALIFISLAIFADLVESRGGTSLGFFAWVAFAGWIGIAIRELEASPTMPLWTRSWRVLTGAVAAMILALPFALGAMSTGATRVPVSVTFHRDNPADTSSFLITGEFQAFIVNCHKDSGSHDVARLCEVADGPAPGVNWGAVLAETNTSSQVVPVSHGTATEDLQFPAYWTSGGRFCGGAWLSGSDTFTITCHKVDSDWVQILWYFVTLGAWRFDIGPWRWTVS